jgi:hypothetical protein
MMQYSAFVHLLISPNFRINGTALHSTQSFVTIANSIYKQIAIAYLGGAIYFNVSLQAKLLKRNYYLQLNNVNFKECYGKFGNAIYHNSFSVLKEETVTNNETFKPIKIVQLPDTLFL